MTLIRSAMLVALLASPAAADDEVALRVSSVWVSDAGIYASGGNNALVQAELGWAHALKKIGRGVVWGEIGYLVGERHDEALGLATSLLVQEVTLGARLTVAVKPWLVPHLRLGGGGVLGGFKVRSNTVGDVQSWAGAASGYALLGLTALLPRAWMGAAGRGGFTLGLVAEGGVVVTSDLAFALSPSPPSDLSSPSSGPSLGALSLTGPLFRVGAVARF